MATLAALAVGLVLTAAGQRTLAVAALIVAAAFAARNILRRSA